MHAQGLAQCPAHWEDKNVLIIVIIITTNDTDIGD